MTDSAYRERIEVVRRFVAHLFADLDATIAAVARDGWPEAMVREGLALHRHTWDVDGLVEAFEAELGAVGGPAALPGEADADRGTELLVEPPDSVVHIWPALPGAGLTPVLFGALLGAPQWVRPSSRGRHFAEYLVDLWPDDELSLKLLEPGRAWTFGEVIVVSGSDETVEDVSRRVRQANPGSRAVVTGYGHRVSFGVVVDNEELDLDRVARRLAFDTVLWHQSGCFSPRAVIFCGSARRLDAFGAALGEAIAAAESRFGTDGLGDADLAVRAQARGVAEFTGRMWGDGIGWVQEAKSPFAGEKVAPHVLNLHHIASLDELSGVMDVPETQIQGVALEAPANQAAAWMTRLAELGATRICAAGRLHAPPPGWRHDGRPNVLEWVRVITTR